MEEKDLDTMPEVDDDVVVLNMDDGSERKFYHIGTLDHKDKLYVLFQPAEEMEDIDEDEVVIYELGEGEDGSDLLLPIEDEALLDEVYDKYVELAEQECECGCDECEDDDCHCEDEHCDCHKK